MERDEEAEVAPPKKEEETILVRMIAQSLDASATDSDILRHFDGCYMAYNGFKLDVDWKPVDQGVYPSDKVYLPQMLIVRVNKKLLDFISRKRDIQAQVLEVEAADFATNKVCWQLDGLGPTVYCELANYNTMSGNYHPTELLPDEYKLVDVILDATIPQWFILWGDAAMAAIMSLHLNCPIFSNSLASCNKLLQAISLQSF